MKYLKNKGLILIGTLLLCCILSLTQLNFITYDRIEDNSNKFRIPRLSNSNITISTPENKTYFEPMSGYYPATLGFENDEDGESQPEGFTNIYASSCNGMVLSETGGHKKVFRVRDNNLAGAAQVLQKFNDAGFQNQTYGMVEYWFRVSNASYNTEIRLNWGSSVNDASIVFRIRGTGSIWQYNDGTWKIMPNVANPSGNTWYHIKIYFRCEGSVSYGGLGENEYEVIIDGISSGALPFTTNTTEIAMFVPIYTASGDYGGEYAFCDAVGYSWDPKYNIGDNVEEGLLLSFETEFNPDWLGYSLDGQINKTILGNTTICMAELGIHSIQVFSNDSLGDIYSSVTRYFTVIGPITILTPENKTYFEPMSGYYPATFGFENVPDGTDDPLWVDNQGTSQIIASLGNHNKIYQCGSGVLAISQLFDSEQSNGTVELYINAEHASNGFQVRIGRNGVGYALTLRIYGDQFEYLNSSGFVSTGKAAFDNTWYHIRIDFETSLSSYMGLLNWTWRAFIDGEEFGPYNFYNNYVPDEFRFYSVSYSTARSWDAVGYSWDPNYNIGDNLNEGLLLSFETEFTPDWLGYSLDGQTIITILGNKTIPFPNDGLHTIQVFGNNSLGTMYQSNLRYFSIDTSPSKKSEIPGFSTILILSLIGLVSLILIKRFKK